MIVLLMLACDTPVEPSSTPAFVPPTGAPAASTNAPSMSAPSMSAPSMNSPAASLAAPATGLSPRQVADDAFNTAMMAYETRQPEARSAATQALAAYGQLANLDSDGAFHVALLHIAAGDPASARSTCDKILAQHPHHLFALATAARATQASGDVGATRTYYQRFVTAWDQPRGALQEYADHHRLLEVYQEDALRFLAGVSP